MCSCGRKVKIGLFILAILLFVVSLIIVFVVVPAVLKSEIEKSVRLENGTKQWDRFVNIPFPLEFKVYIFELKNEDPENMLKPSVEQTGPFVYKQSRQKYDLSVNSEESSISYFQNQKYEYDKEASNGLDQDKEVKILNLPLMALLQTSENLPDLPLAINIDTVIEQVFAEPKLFITSNVKTALFDGIKFCEPSKLNAGSKLFCFFVMMMKLKNVEYQSDGSMKFSYFNYKKDTHDGLYKINTGMNDVNELGKIIEWNKSKYTKFWGKNESECNKVVGYDSTIYPPYIEKTNYFDIFATDICRSVRVNFKDETEYKNTAGYRFELPYNAFIADNPKESCYCLNQTKGMDGEQSCFLDGVLDLYSCFGVQVLLSLPHFLYADEKYNNAVEGLKPDVNEHTTFVELEPNTGTPLQGIKRVQINIVLRQVKFQSKVVKITENLPKAVLPLIWLEEGVSLPDKYVEELQNEYFDKVSLLDGVKWSLVGITAVCVLLSGIWLFCIKSKSKMYM